MRRADRQPPYTPASTLLVFAGVLAAASGPLLLTQPPQAPSLRLSCPPGHVALPARAKRIRARLSSTGRGNELLSEPTTAIAICFRETDEPALMGEMAVLDTRTSDLENAACLGHLIQHARQPAMRALAGGADGSCRVDLEEIVNAEAEAHALELELRRQLGVRDPRRRFAFEHAFWSAPPPKRIEVVRSYLLAHPQGAPGVPALVAAYRRRCEGGGTVSTSGPAEHAP